jgi:hypothetical protein
VEAYERFRAEAREECGEEVRVRQEENGNGDDHYEMTEFYEAKDVERFMKRLGESGFDLDGYVGAEDPAPRFTVRSNGTSGRSPACARFPRSSGGSEPRA